MDIDENLIKESIEEIMVNQKKEKLGISKEEKYKKLI